MTRVLSFEITVNVNSTHFYKTIFPNANKLVNVTPFVLIGNPQELYTPNPLEKNFSRAH